MFLGEGGFGKIDDPFVHVAATCMVGNWLSGHWVVGCWLEAHCMGGRNGGHGCGRNPGSGGMIGCSGRKVGWHI